MFRIFLQSLVALLLTSVPGVPGSTDYVYDSSGNLVFDGDYVYQYDGLNRLVQVNGPGSVVFDDQGKIVGGALGDRMRQYVYDGLGRLVQKRLPGSATDARTRVEDYYYDGVRRIQETVRVPTNSVDSPPPTPREVQDQRLPARKKP